jgi:hypothetical protein
MSDQNSTYDDMNRFRDDPLDVSTYIFNIILYTSESA